MSETDRLKCRFDRTAFNDNRLATIQCSRPFSSNVVCFSPQLLANTVGRGTVPEIFDMLFLLTGDLLYIEPSGYGTQIY